MKILFLVIEPLEYLIITDQDLKEKIFPNLAWAGYIKPEGNPEEGEEPEAYIIILANKKISISSDKDIGASAENINLTAKEEGIGCCWVGAFKKKLIIRILNIPENFSIGLVIALGYPAEKPVFEYVDKNSSIKYYKDSSGILHVSKRKLDDILHFNYFKSSN
jgi:nitroreductase